MSGRKKNVSIESFMVVILMIVFASAICVLIVQGSQTFERTMAQREHDENQRIAMSYINMRIKQNDVAGKIVVIEDPTWGSVLSISHQGGEVGLTTSIFYHDGALYECYSDAEISLDLSTSIIPLDPVTFDYDDENHMIKIHYTPSQTKALTQVIALRTEQVKP